MYFLYSFLLTLGVIALSPRFLMDAFRHGKYVAGWRERLGRLPIIETEHRPVIWLHCVSVGETQAARPLAQALLKEFPSHALVVSTTTLTGQKIAREVFRESAAAIIYFPFDWVGSVRRALSRVNPSLVLIMETELWPNFLRECRKRGVSVAIVNGRLSERSFHRYQLIGRFTRRIVNNLSLAIMQAEADAARLRILGLAPERIAISGNIKFDLTDDAGTQAVTDELREQFSFNAQSQLIVAASTHAPEEKIVLEAFKRLRAETGNNQLRLLIAPRHPERFAEVLALMEASGLNWSRRSNATGQDATSDLILLDSMGELRAVYPLASIVFIGGSMAQTGGHNILEPAAVGACIVTGAHTFNFKAIIETFLEAGALIQLPLLSETNAPLALSSALHELLMDDELRRTLGERARRVLEQNRGATERTIRLLAPILKAAPDSSEQSQPESAHRSAFSA